MSIYFGIDPGVTGAFAFLTSDGPVVVDMPTIGDHQMDTMAIMNLLIEYCTDGVRMGEGFGVIEKAQPMSKGGGRQGISSTSYYMMGYGMVLSCLYIHGMPFAEVPSMVWKKNMGLLRKDKEMSRQKAIQLFPSVADALKRKKDHGRAEALLLAHYARVTAPR